MDIIKIFISLLCSCFLVVSCSDKDEPTPDTQPEVKTFSAERFNTEVTDILWTYSYEDMKGVMSDGTEFLWMDTHLIDYFHRCLSAFVCEQDIIKIYYVTSSALIGIEPVESIRQFPYSYDPETRDITIYPKENPEGVFFAKIDMLEEGHLIINRRYGTIPKGFPPTIHTDFDWNDLDEGSYMSYDMHEADEQEEWLFTHRFVLID